MNNMQRKKSEGFTIIEVLIVLAIAGLILLLVFLGVPNLQRQNRNTGRRTDAGRVATAVSNFVANSNGANPYNTDAAKTTSNAVAIIKDVGTLSQYPGFAEASPIGTAAKNKFSVKDGSSAAVDAITVDGIQLVAGAKCDLDAIGKTTNTGANLRSMALQYVSETSSNTFTGLCLDI